MADKNIIGVKELAKLLDISVASVNYYINIGLIKVAMHKGNKRFFERNKVTHRMKTIREFQKRGFLLRQIKDRLSTR